MGHWYTRDGKPLHYVPTRDGGMRPTTLREARKLDLFPSVTTVIKDAHPGNTLIDWIADQCVISALTHPGGTPKFNRDTAIDSKRDDIKQFLDWCREDSRKKVTDKAELGTSIHDAVNKSYVDPDDVPAHFLAHIDGVRDVMGRSFGEERVWLPERTHTHAELGVGGSIDLDSEEPYGDNLDGLLVDAKCKEFDESKDPARMVFDEHLMQLGGYSLMVRRPRATCANLFISTSNPGLCRLVIHKPEDIARGQAMFTALVSFWRARNKYFP